MSRPNLDHITSSGLAIVRIASMVHIRVWDEWLKWIKKAGRRSCGPLCPNSGCISNIWPCCDCQVHKGANNRDIGHLVHLWCFSIILKGHGNGKVCSSRFNRVDAGLQSCIPWSWRRLVMYWPWERRRRQCLGWSLWISRPKSWAVGPQLWSLKCWDRSFTMESSRAPSEPASMISSTNTVMNTLTLSLNKA